MSEEKQRLAGDQIAEMLEGPVLKRIVGMINRYAQPCNCKGRQEKLNIWHRKYKSITGQDYVQPEKKK